MRRLPMVKIAWNPSHPERVCWGCDKYCRADRLACGNGTERTQHPVELFGPDWLEWAREQGTYDGYEGFDPSADDAPSSDHATSDTATNAEAKR